VNADEPTLDTASRARLPRWLRSVLVVSAVFALAGVALAGWTFVAGGDDQLVQLSDDGPRPVVDPVTREVVFTIPAGTAARQAAGEQVVVLPTRVGIKVNQKLSIRNDDDQAVVIGPFFIAPHEVSTYRFSSPRVIEGACDLHPSGRFVVEVTA